MTDMTTLDAIAGFCNERALWKLLADLTSDVPKWIVPMPERVVVDGDDFRIDTNEPKHQATEFYPPEGMGDFGEAGYVWAVGAVVCYASSGHYVFGGRGGAYQHGKPDAELPTLRKEHSALTPLVKRCLCYSPSQRISLKELHDLALQGLAANHQASRAKRPNHPLTSNQPPTHPDDAWPESFIK